MQCTPCEKVRSLSYHLPRYGNEVVIKTNFTSLEKCNASQGLSKVGLSLLLSTRSRLHFAWTEYRPEGIPNPTDQ